ncbi:MAG: aminopeptidase P N-terminal domain-containing protein [Bacteroidales bacterium]|nr:aminopeptidase P N-terminal domain-containing protein [Bacteroidales bacterium]
MKYDLVNANLFKKNRKKLAEKLSSSSMAVIHANDEMPRNGDQFFPYRQNSDFFYLTGIEQEKSVLVLCPGIADEKLREILFIRKSNKNLEIWEGHKLDLDEAKEISGVSQVKFLEEMDATLLTMLFEISDIYLNLPEFAKFKPEIESRDFRFLNELKNKYPLHSYKRLAPFLKELRLTKEQEEIELIKKACSITGDSFHRILRFVKPGVLEFEVEAEFTHEFIKQGAVGHAYPPIVASGKNACVLHYVENDKICNNGELLLMDFGAEYANYSSDCSRTIPVNGKFTKRQRELYEATLRVFNYAKSLMVPGTTINKFHKEVCKLWEEEHIKLGLYTKKDVANQDKDNPLWFNYYMHGTSHFMGLDVHDVGTKDTEFKPGMILTCEPGIYIPNEQVGIRLENDILITTDGNEDLMANIPIEPDEIETIMNS